MKSVTFYTIHQAPHNTFTFKCLNRDYKLKVFYLKEKHSSYSWQNTEFYYPGEKNGSLIHYLKIALESDLSIISGWHSYKYVILIITLLIFRKKFALYLDMDIGSLRKFGGLKKIILKLTPVVLITGTYGEKFLRRYLRRSDVYNFPYGIKTFNKTEVEEIIRVRKENLQEGDKIRVFISNRFIDRKGYHLVRHLLATLKEKDLLNEFCFTVAGNGPLFEMENALISKISEDIKFLGWIDYNEYRANILNTDIYLHCSEYEPYGIPPVDAYSCMKTIILTDKVYSLYDIIEMGGQVSSFNYNEPQELIDIFLNIVRNKEMLYLSEYNKLLPEIDSYLFSSIYVNTLNRIFQTPSFN